MYLALRHLTTLEGVELGGRGEGNMRREGGGQHEEGGEGNMRREGRAT